jgi:hypothetical protein
MFEFQLPAKQYEVVAQDISAAPHCVRSVADTLVQLARSS